LKNIIQNIVIISGEIKEIGVDNLPEIFFNRKKIKSDNLEIEELYLKDYIKKKEKEYLFFIMEKYGNNKSEAAKVLGISRKTLYEKLNEYNIEY